jgi:hypothetical protein
VEIQKLRFLKFPYSILRERAWGKASHPDKSNAETAAASPVNDKKNHLSRVGARPPGETCTLFFPPVVVSRLYALALLTLLTTVPSPDKFNP